MSTWRVPPSPGVNSSVTVQIAVPTELSPRQRQLIEELAQVSGELPGGEVPRKRLLDRVLSLLEE